MGIKLSFTEGSLRAAVSEGRAGGGKAIVEISS